MGEGSPKEAVDIGREKRLLPKPRLGGLGGASYSLNPGS